MENRDDGKIEHDYRKEEEHEETQSWKEDRKIRQRERRQSRLRR